MSFKKLQVRKYPRRLWQIVGYAGSGKSTFLTQMRAPILPIDADHRIDEVAHLNSDILELSAIASDHNTPDRIAELLNANMPGAQVGTIGVDSLTTIIAPLVVQAMIDKDQGRVKNGYAGFKEKALAMRQLQDNVTKWGTDVLWIFHLDTSTDAAGKTSIKETISKTELARLMRSVNLKLEVVLKEDKRGLKVKWARKGRWGDQVGILWDESGTWQGMPERVEAAVYDGLSEADQLRLETELPTLFPDDVTAIGWGLEQGAFDALEHSRNAFDKLMRENGEPETMEEKTALWIGDVLARLEALKTVLGNGHSDAPAALPPPATPITHNEFWARVNALKMRADAQVFIKANTIGSETNWGAALADMERKAGAGR